MVGFQVCSRILTTYEKSKDRARASYLFWQLVLLRRCLLTEDLHSVRYFAIEIQLCILSNAALFIWLWY